MRASYHRLYHESHSGRRSYLGQGGSESESGTFLIISQSDCVVVVSLLTLLRGDCYEFILWRRRKRTVDNWIAKVIISVRAYYAPGGHLNDSLVIVSGGNISTTSSCDYYMENLILTRPCVLRMCRALDCINTDNYCVSYTARPWLIHFEISHCLLYIYINYYVKVTRQEFNRNGVNVCFIMWQLGLNVLHCISFPVNI